MGILTPVNVSTDTQASNVSRDPDEGGFLNMFWRQ